MKVLYAISSWSGTRDGLQFDDSYICRHVNYLKKVKHNLSQISIGDPENPKKRPCFTNFMSEIQKAGETPVVVHPMSNHGRSYGQWSRIYEKYRTDFDYYIFIEDDYIPVLDNFDSVLVEMFDKFHKEQNCGFLCGLVLEPPARSGHVCTEIHAGVSNGIASSAVLEKVYEKFGCLPHDKAGYFRGQIDFSQGFIQTGFTLCDYISDEYRCLYYQHNTQCRIYGPNDKAKDILSPLQVVENPAAFQYRQYREDDKPVKPTRGGRRIPRVAGKRRR